MRPADRGQRGPFVYDNAVVERFPSVRAGVVHATALTNRPSSSELLAEYHDQQEATAQSLQETEIAALASIAAWRRTFRHMGVKPTQYRNAAEALLRRLSKHGSIPTISTLVDLGNLVSVRYAVPVALFDLAHIAGSLTVRLATGEERFTDLGSSATLAPDPGEVIFVDDDDVVSARRWCWRQSAQSATSPATTEALFVVEGHHDHADRDIDAAVDDLTALLESHQPGSGVKSLTLPEDPGR